MKYKLIQIEKYLLAIEESKVNEGDYGLGFAEGINGIGRGYNLFFHDGSNSAKINTIAENTYKVVAHLPLNDSEILENVPLLPSLEQEDDVEKMAIEEVGVDDEIYNPYDHETFIKGYNKAKEKYKWSDEDVIKIVEKSRETGLTAEYLLLIMSQPKIPIAFECELDTLQTKDLGNGYSEFIQPLQKVWIGKYNY